MQGLGTQPRSQSSWKQRVTLASMWLEHTSTYSQWG